MTQERLRALLAPEHLRRFGLSLVLALILWAVVTVSQDPRYSRTFTNIPVTVGEMSELMVVGAVPQINVQVSGPRSDITEIISTDIRAALDLSQVSGPGTYSVPIDVSVPNTVWNWSATPRQIAIVVDRTDVRQIPLTIEITGDVNATQQIGTITPDTTEVTVRGPESVMARIAEVVLPVDVANQTRDFVGVFTPFARDRDGAVISEVTIAPSSIVTSVEITARGKRVAIITQIEGSPAAGYEVVDRTLNPQTALVDGPADVLANLISVSTEPVSVDGATETVQMRASITGLPDGVRLLDPADGVVDVVVQIRRQGERQALPSQQVQVTGMGPGLIATVEPGSVELVVVASDATISQLGPGDVTVSVDISGLGPGTYELDLRVSLPARMVWVEASPPRVTVVIRAEPVASPVATAELSPSATPSS